MGMDYYYRRKGREVFILSKMKAGEVYTSLFILVLSLLMGARKVFAFNVVVKLEVNERHCLSQYMREKELVSSSSRWVPFRGVTDATDTTVDKKNYTMVVFGEGADWDTTNSGGKKNSNVENSHNSKSMLKGLINQFQAASALPVETLFDSFGNIHRKIPVEQHFLVGNNSSEYKVDFRCPQSGPYHFCVANPMREPVYVEVDIRWGIDARDYSTLLKSEHLSPLLISLRKSIKQIQDYEQSAVSLHDSREKLQSSIEFTSFYVVLIGLITIALIIASATMQVFYFRAFFRAKKLI